MLRPPLFLVRATTRLFPLPRSYRSAALADTFFYPSDSALGVADPFG